MPIKEHVARGAKPDEISEVIGNDSYFMRYYPKGLRERCLGPYTKDLVGVSRFYPMLERKIDDESGKELPKQTPVAVDFEPGPNEGKMFLEEKRKYFMEEGIIYVPVFLTEILTKEQFAERLEEERQNLVRGFREEMEDAAMEKADVPFFADDALIAEVNAIALERVQALGLRGAAKNKRLVREKEIILKEKLANVTRMGNGRRGLPTAQSVG
jgi:hypothetical protein